MKINKETIISVIFALALFTVITGCARMKNNVAAKGGFFGSYPADYIVLSQSGGKIMDVWKLNNVIVQSATNSDGWLFLDKNNNAINIGGDVKVIRLNSRNSDLWQHYHEYHMEFESQTYREKYGKAN